MPSTPSINMKFSINAQKLAKCRYQTFLVLLDFITLFFVKNLVQNLGCFRIKKVMV